MIRRGALFFLICIIGASSFGCAQLVSGLRRDLDEAESYDAPVIGGRWTEQGVLSEAPPNSDQYYGSGRGDRVPAGERGVRDMGSRSWVTPDSEEASVSSANTPVLEPLVRRQYKNGSRATRADFVDESPNEGSLWASDGQTNYYFTKNKVRGVGDILSVNLEDAIVRDVGLEIRRTLTVREREVELALAKERAKIRLAEEESKKAGSGERKPAVEEKKGPYSASTPEEKDIPVSLADVDMSKTLELKAGETMMAEIVERYSNGNYRIRGTKRVPYRYGPPRLVTIMAVAKGGDISEEDVITSGKLYEYRVEAVR